MKKFILGIHIVASLLLVVPAHAISFRKNTSNASLDASIDKILALDKEYRTLLETLNKARLAQIVAATVIVTYGAAAGLKLVKH